LPGPPRELQPMFDSSVMPVIKQGAGDLLIIRRKLSIYGLTESRVDEIAAPIYTEYANPSTTILFKDGQIELHLTAQASAEGEAIRLLDELEGRLDKALEDYIFSKNDETLEEVVGSLLRSKGYTLATAESCTGGLLSGRITDIPGSSDYFLEGAVTYSNEAKTRQVGVPQKLIEEHGAVSEEVAKAMAEGTRERAGSTFGIGITGIAGPSGGTAERPVGLVYIALAGDMQTDVKKFLFPGDRQLIRTLSVNAALDMIRRRIR
ncbi:MAG: nicotinamide-nucleotide amidohydrolase family protein, partial [Blastocatellia bacterium]|nr:nicotinamide-nucleotide amidohydrolase family protein [Blastocatellia bacterium]